MTGPSFTPDALAYFAERAIDPERAAQLGVHAAGGEIVYTITTADGATFERRRPLNGNGSAKVLQPPGEPLAAWWPAGRPDSEPVALVCEGESDALAALSALPHGPEVAGLADMAVVAIPGTGFNVDRLADELAGIGARQALLALDADDAGRACAERAAAALALVGVQPAPVELSDGDDLAAALVRFDGPAERGEWLANTLVDAGCAAPPLEEPAASSNGAGPQIAAPATGELLDTIVGAVNQYVILPSPHATTAVALWVAHTWAFEGAHATPYLLVVSPERRSGKTRLLEVLELLVRSPWRVTSASEAAMFRKIDQAKPTLLLDEIDAIFGSATERTEPLRAVLNSGNRPGSSVARCVGDGANQQVVDFEVYCPKILAGIDTGRVPDTITDRAIRIAMKRKLTGEQADAFRHRYATEQTNGLREAAEAWGNQYAEGLSGAEPDVPHGLNDRAAEAWEPLFAIADLAGGEWPARARAASVALIGDDADEPGHGARLLHALREIFAGRDILTTAAILDQINADEELPFGGWRHGDGLDPRGLSKLLKPYGVRPRTVRPDGAADTARGYRREQFEEPWARYLPSSGQSPTQPTQATQAAPGPEPDVLDVSLVSANPQKGAGDQ